MMMELVGIQVEVARVGKIRADKRGMEEVGRRCARELGGWGEV